MLINDRKDITLTLTQQCNLNCIYCYEGNKSNKVMTFETAKRILDESLNDDRFKEYEIDFFGGEPFLRFDLIKQCLDYIIKTYPEKKMVFMATTNGTLVHGEIKEWLRKNSKFFYCSLSFDGTPEMQNINRSNSADRIDVDFFAKTWPDQPMKMTVSAKTLPMLAEGVIYMHEKGYNFTANLAYDVGWMGDESAPILERELMKLVNYYLEHPDVKPCWIFELPLYHVAYDKKTDDLRQCGAGVEMVSYDVDGKAYPCHFFMPITVGEEKAANAKNLVFPHDVYPEHFGSPCRECPAVSICHTCYGADYSMTGDIFKKDENMCRMNKIIFKATAYLRWQQFKRGTLDVPADQKPYYLKAIQILLNELK